MKKMPCVFEREFHDNHSSTILPRVTPGCEWVLAGEGVATRKWDGTACMVKGGKLYARYDAKRGKTAPPGAIPCEPEPDAVTGHWPHWVEVADQPQFKWHRHALRDALPDGTYELIGPFVNGNPERLSAAELISGAPVHRLVQHGLETYPDAPRDFDGLKAYLAQLDAEGIVFHHPDGRMAKIRRRDFGFGWGAKS